MILSEKYFHYSLNCKEGNTKESCNKFTLENVLGQNVTDFWSSKKNVL